MNLKTTSAEETARLGEAMGPWLRPGDTVLLEGDLGAGKSVLARGIARGLGIDRPMPSPTFTLMQPYQGRLKLYHFDLYRLEGEDEFFEAGLDEFVGGDGVAVVEWPDQAALQPVPCLRVAIQTCDDGEARRLTLTGEGLADRMAALQRLLTPWRCEI